MKTPERRQWRRSGIFIVNFERISHFALVFHCSNFKVVNAGWEQISCQYPLSIYPPKSISKKGF